VAAGVHAQKQIEWNYHVKDVTIYTRQFCGFCTAAKRLLSEKGVEFTEHDATFDPSLKQEMIKRSQGGSTFPQIFIGNEHVGGCDDLFALEKSGALGVMLEG
jgi:glutaredoxin 3